MNPAYVFHCPDCDATSPTLATAAILANITRSHDCNNSCTHCRWRHTGHGLRGLCAACWQNPTIRANYPRSTFAADELLDEWTLLRSEGHTLRQAAERLGITYAALDKALQRAKHRGDPRAIRQPGQPQQRPGRAA
jgi:hypothetical protein